MPRTIYLAVCSNGARPAHFSVFIPTGDSSEVGKRIHVTGNTATGFFLEFKRNCDFREYKHQLISLAQVDDRFVTDTVADGQESADTTARDPLESVATVVPPPCRSPNPFDPSAPNCQTWLESYIQKLVDDGYIDSSAISIVQNALRVLR